MRGLELVGHLGRIIRRDDDIAARASISSASVSVTDWPATASSQVAVHA
jgi:hypothetical protein